MTNEQDWQEDFFRGPFGEMQLAGLRLEEAPAEVDFFESVLPVGCRILDVPCGPGRHSLELARRGFRVTGVDWNPDVVEAGRKAAEAEQLGVDFRTGDTRQLDFDGDFDAVLCWWGSFGYFDDDGNADFVRGAAQALKPGGKLLIDTHVAESLYPKFRPRDWQWWEAGAQRFRCLEERRFDLETSRVISDWTFVRDGREETTRVSIRIYAYRELVGMLRSAEFESFEVTDSTGEAFGLGSGRLRLVAGKAA